MDTEPWHTSESVAAPAAEEAQPAEAGAFPERGVYSRLFREGYRFEFFQAVRLLEQLFEDAPAPGETPNYRDERIRFRPDTALVFPATDVKRIERLEGELVEVIATFMGLYGIDSPLPYYFYDDLAKEDESTLAHRDFLDIFNHRLYAYFYRAWKKYRPGLHHRPGKRNAQATRFLALAGLGTPRALDETPVPPMRLAALAGRFGPRTRNAEGLEAMLRLLLDNIPVEIIENVPRWVPIRVRSALGQTRHAMRLGQDAAIGEQVYDRSGKFRIRLGPVGVDDYLALLPGGDRAEMVDWLVRTYAPDYLDFDIELHVRTAELPVTRLGDMTAKLGLTTSLGQPSGAAIQRIVEYEP
jgi:type VI secretion system protein ImpH